MLESTLMGLIAMVYVGGAVGMWWGMTTESHLKTLVSDPHIGSDRNAKVGIIIFACIWPAVVTAYFVQRVTTD